jgi:hypothetical protein
LPYLDRIPAVEKTFRQSTQKIQRLAGLAQQKRIAIGTDRPAVETGYNFPLPAGFPQALNPKLDWLHSVIPKAVLWGRQRLCGNSVMPRMTAFCPLRVRKAG